MRASNWPFFTRSPLRTSTSSTCPPALVRTSTDRGVRIAPSAQIEITMSP